MDSHTLLNALSLSAPSFQELIPEGFNTDVALVKNKWRRDKRITSISDLANWLQETCAQEAHLGFFTCPLKTAEACRENVGENFCWAPFKVDIDVPTCPKCPGILCPECYAKAKKAAEEVKRLPLGHRWLSNFSGHRGVHVRVLDRSLWGMPDGMRLNILKNVRSKEVREWIDEPASTKRHSLRFPFSIHPKTNRFLHCIKELTTIEVAQEFCE